MTLDGTQLFLARTLNPIVVRMLRLRDRLAPRYESDSIEFALEIASIQEDLGVDPSGIVDYETIRVVLGDDLRPQMRDHIILGGECVPIDADVRDFSEKKIGGLSFRDFNRGYSKRRHAVRRMTVHWDATLSSEDAFKVLVKRKYSSHFGVNYDGTIYQWLDPDLYIAYHIREDNQFSVGIDLNNPVDIKWRDRCDRQGHIRPVLEMRSFGRRSGKYPEFLGYTPAQILAGRELIRVLCGYYDVPRNPPGGSSADWWRVAPELTVGADGKHIDSEVRGVYGHLNNPISANAGKWDPLGVPWDQLMD